jgi:D-alanine-D-alanine ligase
MAIASKDDIPSYTQACDALNTDTLIVKPAACGSSVGVFKVNNPKDFIEKTQEAFLYSTRILIERAITGSEIECAILGHNAPVASGVGEIVVHTPDRMYSYAAKYNDPAGKQATVHVQAQNLAEPTQEAVRAMAVKAFKILGCSGLARVDFFATEKDLFINEINTIPGFTEISLYPQLWEQAGLSAQALISQLLKCATERFEEKQRIRTTLN